MAKSDEALAIDALTAMLNARLAHLEHCIDGIYQAVETHMADATVTSAEATALAADMTRRIAEATESSAAMMRIRRPR